jgi:hypothetical protein
MKANVDRRGFIRAAAGCALCWRRWPALADGRAATPLKVVSPGCVKSKVRIGRIYAGIPQALWPTPKLDLGQEIRRYEAGLREMREMADVEFVANRLITRPEQVAELSGALKDVDGILVIHLSMGISPILQEVLKSRRPTVLFAAPYSGHEWTSFGALRKKEEGALLECILSSSLEDLAAAVRPFRAIHHLREAKIVNVSTRPPAEDYLKAVRERFGTEISTVGSKPVIDAYHAVSSADAESETERWIRQAEKVVEPPRDEILRSCRLALAFERILAQEQASCLTVDCYGSMYRQLPAFPCVGFVRLNDMGLGGICESDLLSAMTHILAQGLSGRPGFISDPTMDESVGTIILAHCLGTLKMDGPEGEPAPYRLRTIMERQEGCVPQVRMRVGQRVTQLRLIGAESVRYFTGTVTGTPDTDRGCRTQITVKVDGDCEKLWQEWSHGLHRTTVYGDIARDLNRFCRFKGLNLIQEA